MEVKWYGINALEFRAPGVSFMIDPYVSRDRGALHHPEEVDRYANERFRTERVNVRAYRMNSGAYDSGFSDGRNHLSRKVRGQPVRQLK